MNKYRYISNISEEEEGELEKLLKSPKINEREKSRIRAILRSHKGYTIDEIAEITDVDRDTVSKWFNNWEGYGAVGLMDRVKQNRRSVLNEEEQETLKRVILENPRSAKEVSVKLEKETGKKLSHWSVKRWAKRLGLRWKRVRKSVKLKRDEEAFRRAQEDIEAFKSLEKQGKALVVYLDVAGFNLTPTVPYAWQASGREGTLELPSAKSQRLNVLGFLGNNGSTLDSFIIEGSVTSLVVKACFDSYCKHHHAVVPTVVIIDNAPVHTAHVFIDSIDKWHEMGVFPYFLPTYSPELNLIEILWKRIKYSWLAFDSYESLQKLKSSLEEILVGFGSKYQFCFA